MRKIVVCATLSAGEGQVITTELVRDALSKVGVAEIEMLEVLEGASKLDPRLTQAFWVLVPSDEEEPYQLVCGLHDVEGTEMPDALASHLRDHGVCVRFHCRYPSADRYGVPGFAASQAMASAEASQHFPIAEEGMDFSGEDTGDDTVGCYTLRVLCPPVPEEMLALVHQSYVGSVEPGDLAATQGGARELDAHVNPGPSVRAKCKTDDGVMVVDFDAGRWFSSAGREDVLALANCGFQECERADAVAEFMASLVVDLKQLMDYTVVVTRAGKDCGFECFVNGPDAMGWLKANRPGWWAMLLCEQNGVRLVEAQEEEIKGRWDWLDEHGNACDGSLVSDEAAALDAVKVLRLETVGASEVRHG